ncbi:diguanylate cyclase domain-containing protein [Paenibacillus qinlingensis]|uniref:Diguanylate cyclase (GGDEF)-like protein/PAS domain S-box-containing protein n=1 Tax=Paenibacillus qinlingensis TaxID=1837343 RepID=A0ABU1NWU9_9BACL|nr:diguanylate cyclase [Paenibacillus qinlingensis]MDR6551951.1 diguanylate cyclase (GGDEF)-like protein/PAS domain S-box-containing protein [Paenibacillus qinlingensis]
MHHSQAESYNYVLVLLSFVIALLSSYTALNLARKVSTSVGWHQKSWILCSALVMGIGIWSMHFIAMLAYHLPNGITYHISIVSISVLVAVGGALIGLVVAFQAGSIRSSFLIGGTIMGLAISGMHYIGMAALQNVTIQYRPLPFTLSIVIAIFASITALYFFFKRNQQRLLTSSLIMGAAITGMHYMGMAAADMSFPTETHAHSGNAINMDFYVVAMYVAFGALLIFAISFISSLSVDRRLSEQIALKASILESAIDCIFMFKSQGWIIEFNPAAETIFGYTRQEALRRTFFDLLFPFDQNGQDAALLFQLISQKSDSVIGKRFEITAYRADRTTFPAEIIITNRVYGGKTIFTAYLRDLTEKRKSEELIRQLAYYDHLTGLPNRNQFNEQFQLALSYAQRHQETLGVLYLDIYRFKWINDNFGHLIGDQTLHKFASLLTSCLPEKGSAFRLSGDEFVILLPQGNQVTLIEQAQTIITLLKIPFRMDIGDIFVSTNLGISMYPNDGETLEQLLKHADQAMYAAKELGRNNYQFYKPGMQMKYAQRTGFEQYLQG